MPAAVKLPSWDSALVDKRGNPRPAYTVLEKQLARYRRAAARRAAPKRIDGR